MVVFSTNRQVPTISCTLHHTYAFSSGCLLQDVAMSWTEKLDRTIRRYKPGPGMPILAGSWTQIKVNLRPGHTMHNMLKSDGKVRMRRSYFYAVEANTTWRELLRWMILARKDFFDLRKGWAELTDVSTDVFA